MERIAKTIKFIFNYTTRQVTDVETRKPEIATYFRVFGFVVKTTYKPM
ncbi:hypothetical protein HNP69_003020 [Chryseobacterium koreense]|nr:hypothetical protein [Chryseobacterium koreense]